MVSVIMPAYNSEKYISDSINSVLRQTYSNWELIIVDDGSIDKTSNIVLNYVSKDKRISYYYQENGKQGKARNLAISKAKGDLLAFIDSDDIWHPEKLKIQVSQIAEKDVDLVFSNSYIFNTETSSRAGKFSVNEKIFNGADSILEFLSSNKIPILTVLVKKDSVNNAGMFSEEVLIQNAEDYHLWLKLLQNNCKFYASNLLLAFYRIHSESVTANEKSFSKASIYVRAKFLGQNINFLFQYLINIVNEHDTKIKELNKKLEKLQLQYILIENEINIYRASKFYKLYSIYKLIKYKIFE